MTQNKNFFKTVYRSLNPLQYELLSERRTPSAVKYLFSFLFLAFLAFTIVSIPFLLSLPTYVGNKLSSFDTFEIDMNTEMNSPLRISNILYVDTRADDINLSQQPEERFLITNKYVYSKKLFSNKYNQHLISDYKDVVSNKELYSNLLLIALFLAIPSILLTGYVIFAIKYLLLIIIMAGIVFSVATILKFNINFLRLFKIGVYAVTPPIILEIVGLVLNFSQFRLHIILFIVLFLFASYRSGTLEEMQLTRKRPRMKFRPSKRKKQYADAGDL